MHASWSGCIHCTRPLLKKRTRGGRLSRWALKCHVMSRQASVRYAWLCVCMCMYMCVCVSGHKVISGNVNERRHLLMCRRLRFTRAPAAAAAARCIPRPHSPHRISCLLPPTLLSLCSRPTVIVVAVVIVVVFCIVIKHFSLHMQKRLAAGQV